MGTSESSGSLLVSPVVPKSEGSCAIAEVIDMHPIDKMQSSFFIFFICAINLKFCGNAFVGFHPQFLVGGSLLFDATH